MWYEPWFFQQRIRNFAGWAGLGLILGIITILVAVAIGLTAQQGNPLSLWEFVGLPLGTAFAVWWLFDGTETRRTATLDDQSLVVGGDMGKYSSPTIYKLADIAGAAIVMPEESNWPTPALYFLCEGQEAVIGIEEGAGLKRLAQALHDVGVPIRMDGWEPGQDNGFEKAFRWQAVPGTTKPTATISKLPDSEPGLYNIPGILWAIFLQCWALVLWLALAASLGYYAYQNGANLGLGMMAVFVVVVFATFMAAAQYTDRFATAATSDVLTRGAIKQIAQRSRPLINPQSEDLLPVEIFERDQFERTIQKMYEMGFVQVDIDNARILFEGKKQQWVLPTQSIKSVAMEEIQTGTPGQSALGALNYYTTLQFATAEGEKELGFRYAVRDYGEVNDLKRAAGGITLFEAMECILPAGVQVQEVSRA
ncbi:MAG: hypothetical protein WBD20_28260 [Pirellulaceae bacterium]